MELSVGAVDANGGGGVDDGSTSITLNVIPAEAPVRLESFGSVQLTYPEQGTLAQRQLSVYGYYADGTRRTLTKAMLGTTYTSSNPAVATVDANGLITTTGTSIAYITIENQGVHTFSQVTVEDPSQGRLPARDYTDSVSIGAGGFRRDPETGLSCSSWSFATIRRCLWRYRFS